MAYNPAEPRDAHGRWTAGPHLSRVLKGHNVRGQALNAGTAKNPINVHGNVMLGARLIAQGKHVRLNKVDQVGTLLADLLKLSKEAKAKHETLDLCRVSVPKTNLFCAKNKGIDRIKMPQLAGVPSPGSKAAALQKNPGDEVDLTDQFEKTLRAEGVKVTDTTLPAASFKATQDQLIGDKVAGIEKFMETAPKDSGIFEPIFVTRDHYIIDGHHRWAGMIGLDAKDGVLGNYPMKVRMVDMDIGEALAAAGAFARDWGIASEGTEHAGPTVAKFATKSLSTSHRVNLDLAFNPAEPRDSHGRWTSLGGLTGMALARHLRALPSGSHVQLGEKMSYSKHGGQFFQKGAAQEPISSEGLAAVLGGSSSAKSRTPEDYVGAKREMLDTAERIAYRDPGNPSMNEGADPAKDRARISDLAAGNPDLLDDPEVRNVLTLSGDIGLRRLVSGHDYMKRQTPEGKAQADALSEKMMADRAKKAAAIEAKRQQDALLDDLNDKVSDYEFNAVFGISDDGHDIKSMLAEHPELLKTAKGKSLLGAHPELTGIPPTYRQASSDYDWPDEDLQGLLRPEDKSSVHQEHEAQIAGEFWHDTADMSDPDEKIAHNLWEAYQSPQAYGLVNGALRNGTPPKDSGVDLGLTVQQVRDGVAKMFEDGGMDLKKPMTLYHAIRSSDEPGHNWAENLKVGSVFTDKGIVSCTAHGRFAQGWLNNDAIGQEQDTAMANDVVLEIHAPKGQRVLGGTKQFIETMLPPGTHLKIISNEKRRADEARNPLNAGITEDPFTYTHVIAEVLQS